uniref:Uncharacterized protein n=1 Tax=Phaeomonas parva TaxID=124430 RepID=A0A7S1XJJ0_9STRA|mmetsp:Transcript_12277/g.36939  ORF Transcript_12277/g.36939 Transcript_12277/m.36939 type:complete len:300 (+) Transcript_12277:106-1005(+)
MDLDPKVVEGAYNLALYLGAPFFSYPHKPFLQLAKGAAYARAYFHFRRDHQDAFNLAMHFFCLFYQLYGNYGWLSALDGFFGTGGFIPTLTTIFWSGALYYAVDDDAEEAPIVRASAILLLLFFFAVRGELEKYWTYVATLQALSDAAVYVTLVKKEPITEYGMLAGALAARIAVTFVCFRLRGCLSKMKSVVNVALLSYMVYGTQMNPYHGIPYAMSFGLWGWILAFLTDQPAIYFWSTGFAATMLQGVAHAISGEQGTMPTLHNYADEVAHVTYFPVLLLRSCYESVNAIPPPVLET